MIGSDEETKYVIDGKQTLYANAINIAFFLIIVFLFDLLMKQIRTLTEETNVLLGTIIAMFVLIKLVTWTIHPKFIYKERSK